MCPLPAACSLLVQAGEGENWRWSMGGRGRGRGRGGRGGRGGEGAGAAGPREPLGTPIAGRADVVRAGFKGVLGVFYLLLGYTLNS